MMRYYTLIALFLVATLLIGCTPQSMGQATQPTNSSTTVDTQPTQQTQQPTEPTVTEPLLTEEERQAKAIADELASQAQADYDLFAQCTVLWCGVDSAEKLAEGEKAIWVQELPSKAPSKDTTTNKGRVKAIYIYYPCSVDPSKLTEQQMREMGLTRVFGYLGIPKANGPVPGMVYIHGAAGHASVSCVVEIMNHGYAAISLDTEGTYNVTSTSNFSESGSAFKSDPLGHIGKDEYATDQEPLKEQAMYWAVADTILATSVMRSLPEVDKVGATGISWGGIILTTTICFDYRLEFAVPIYGSFGLEYNSAYMSKMLEGRLVAQYLWQNRERLAQSPVPTLLHSGDDDLYASINCNVLTYETLKNSTIIIKRHFDHSQQHGISAPETYRYADYILGRSEGFITPDREPTAEDGLQYTLTLQIPDDMKEPEVTLHYMRYAIRKYQNSNSLPLWNSVKLPYDAETKTVAVTVPEDAYMYYITFEGHNDYAKAMRDISPYRQYTNYAADAVYSSTSIVLLKGDTIQHIYEKRK